MEIDSKEIQTKIGAWFKGGFNLYKENFIVVFVSCIIAMVLGVVSIGILAGPLLVGVFMILFRLIEKSSPPPFFSDVFKGFEQFIAGFLFVIVCAIVNFCGSLVLRSVPNIGGLLGFAYSCALGGLVIFGLPLIADKKLDFWAALELSIQTVKPKLIQYLIFSFAGSIITISGGLLMGVGVLLTFPFYLCSVAVAYKDVFGTTK